ncbi:hypothetical protein PPYR_07996 [Photinus pyralis]|uniref:Kazal-like domain-containing protein n=1 Tax=Photinus pyralis TaxID=7054 RepID=A0A1Y1M6D2_PHOPY|nr:uncharacterized protein LOC116167591 [Photinus pyralis]XP_031338845.1 uncharacterized protein LOC116167593 [Photinus pyralis]KAB0800116.1 hypothetical protein PPYR_07996 [Photinus pyralis]
MKTWSSTCIVAAVVCFCQITSTHSQAIIFEDDEDMRPAQPTSSPTPNDVDAQPGLVDAATFTVCYNDCQSRVLKEFNPLCGSNGFTYDNPRLFRCAQNCGLRITVSSPGRC